MEKLKRLETLKKEVNRLESKIKKLEITSNKYTWGRLIIFTIGFVATILSFSLWGKITGSIILVISIITFLISVYYHVRLDSGIKKLKLWKNLKIIPSD